MQQHDDSLASAKEDIKASRVLYQALLLYMVNEAIEAFEPEKTAPGDQYFSNPRSSA